MNNIARSSVVAVAVIAAACGRKDNTVVASSVDVLAKDTTLKLAPQPTADQYLGPQDIKSVAAAAPGAPVVTATPTPTAPVLPAQHVQRTRSSRQTTLASRRIASSTIPARATSRARRIATTTSTHRSRSTTRVASQSDVSPNNVTVSPSRVIEAESREQTSRATRSKAVIAAGSEMTLASQEKVCTDDAVVGSRFKTQIANDVVGANGAVIPKGAAATAVVSSVAKNPTDRNDLGIGLKIISVSFNGRMYPVSSDVTSAEFNKVRSRSRGSDIAKVATGSAIGAGIGRVLGRNTQSTVIGAVGGAAAGAVVANQSGAVRKCVPNGGLLTARLAEPLTVEASE